MECFFLFVEDNRLTKLAKLPILSAVHGNSTDSFLRFDGRGRMLTETGVFYLENRIGILSIFKRILEGNGGQLRGTGEFLYFLFKFWVFGGR